MFCGRMEKESTTATLSVMTPKTSNCDASRYSRDRSIMEIVEVEAQLLLFDEGCFETVVML